MSAKDLGPSGASSSLAVDGLGAIVATATAQDRDLGLQRPIPPVHLWSPAHCGEIDIRIRKDGLWFHEGSPIGREGLVRLFSSVLRKDDDGFHLVTPVEKMKIVVEDAPFLAVRVDRVDGVLRFLTNVGEVVDAGPEHGLRVTADPETGEPHPYLHVRRGLEARLRRPVFYELVEMAEEQDTPEGRRLMVRSGEVWFNLGSPIAAV